MISSAPNSSAASSSSPVTFRDAITDDDFRLIDSLARRIWPATYGAILQPEQIEFMLSWMYSLETLRNEVTTQNIRFFFVVDPTTHTEIGFVSYGPTPNPTEAMIHKVYLLPDFHGKGFGQAMLHEALSRIQAHGFSSAILHVNRYNQRAIRAYQRAGFSTKRSVVTDIGHGYIMDDFELEFTFPIPK